MSTRCASRHLMKHYLLSAWTAILLLFLPIPSFIQAETPPKAKIYQVSLINALLDGCYDGFMSLGELLQHGDFGLGTFDRLDGEMVVYEGVVYQVRADGRVYRPEASLKTPFAAVTFYRPTRQFPLQGPWDLERFEREASRLFPEHNSFLALCVEGEFSQMHVRSVAAQSPPYRPLVEVAAAQSEFHYENIRGVLVGFRCPPYARGFNVPGYHLHFLSEDKTVGGHVLNFILKQGQLTGAVISDWQIRLPEPDAAGFEALDLLRDRQHELHAVEQK